MDSFGKLQVLAAEFERLAERGVRSAPDMGRLVGELHAEVDALVRQRQELASLYEIARELAAASDLSSLLESIVDRAITVAGAERGFVVLLRPSGEYYIAVPRRVAAEEIVDTDEAFSSSLVRRVIQAREPILTTNVQTDERFELSQSILVQDIRSVLAVPLIARGELQGAIYVDTRMSVRHFSEADLKLLEAMASQAAMAIRTARLFEDVRRSNEQLHAALDELRETQNQLVQAERLAAVGRLAASVAHELRSPLMVMRNSIYYLDRLVSEEPGGSPDSLKRYFSKLDSEIDRQSKIINDLLFFSRDRPRELKKVDLNATIVDTLARVPMSESIVVQQVLDPELEAVTGDAEKLQQVFVNLISNAVHAMPEGGTLTVRTRSEPFVAVVRVTDTGVGIPEENLSRLFEPFFTTRENGIGLGLSVTRSIVDGHSGSIEVNSTVGVGTTFTVRLPFELIG